ncbi:MAG TPA: hypothetical protein VGI39_32905 [Polyangiaceae bacterium]
MSTASKPGGANNYYNVEAPFQLVAAGTTVTLYTDPPLATKEFATMVCLVEIGQVGVPGVGGTITLKSTVENVGGTLTHTVTGSTSTLYTDISVPAGAKIAAALSGASAAVVASGDTLLVQVTAPGGAPIWARANVDVSRGQRPPVVVTVASPTGGAGRRARARRGSLRGGSGAAVPRRAGVAWDLDVSSPHAMDEHDLTFENVILRAVTDATPVERDPAIVPSAGALKANLERIATQLLYVHATIHSLLESVPAVAIRAFLGAIKDAQPGTLPEALVKEFQDFSFTEEAARGMSRTALRALSQHGPIRDAMVAQLAGAVIALWTALECLTGDMWESAINANPTLLSKVEFKDGLRVPGITDKNIEIWQLQKHGFDLRNKMGTIFRRRFDFSSIEDISKSYKTVFGKEIVGIIGDNPCIRVLEATRHLLVHRGGLVDEGYVSKWDAIAEESKLQFDDGLLTWCFPGKQLIPLTPGIVATFYEAAGSFGVAMIQMVDGALKSRTLPGSVTPPRAS